MSHPPKSCALIRLRPTTLTMLYTHLAAGNYLASLFLNKNLIAKNLQTTVLNKKATTSEKCLNNVNQQKIFLRLTVSIDNVYVEYIHANRSTLDYIGGGTLYKQNSRLFQQALKTNIAWVF